REPQAVRDQPLAPEDGGVVVKQGSGYEQDRRRVVHRRGGGGGQRLTPLGGAGGEGAGVSAPPGREGGRPGGTVAPPAIREPQAREPGDGADAEEGEIRHGLRGQRQHRDRKRCEEGRASTHGDDLRLAAGAASGDRGNEGAVRDARAGGEMVERL